MRVLVAAVWLISCSSESIAGSTQAEAILAKRSEVQKGQALRELSAPTYIESKEISDGVQVDVYGELDQPVLAVQHLLQSAPAICEMLLLHVFIKSCEIHPEGDASALKVTMGGTKVPVPTGAQSLSYHALPLSVETGLVSYAMAASNGPMGTFDYQFQVEALALPSARTWIHMRYAYRYGLLAKMAMKTYQAAAGRTKIGFTVVGRNADGSAQYVQGERGSLERNAMRIYLAIGASLDPHQGPAAQRMDARRRKWFAMTELFAAQLHEYSLEEYLAMKQTAVPAGLE